MNVNVEKTVPISFKEVVDAYAAAKQGGKATGIDRESWSDFEANLMKNLYVVWNRMASGAYFPQPVRLKMIPKADGKQRKLGIPAIRDRIAQHVLKARLEPRLEPLFSNSSYGYRPHRNAHQAIEAVKEANRKYDWVVDLDISKFFDEIDHGLMIKALETVVHEKWMMLYIKRILEAPEQDEDGTQHSRNGLGTPQGGVISPLLANLYLHYALDRWLEKNHSGCSFVRYADDMVIHCRSQQQAEALMQAVSERLSEVKLRLNQTKSKIVYCKDYRRRGTHEHTSFKFLGFLFRPRAFQNKQKEVYHSFMPAISNENQSKIRESIRKTVIWRDTSQTLEDIAAELNHKLRGWINYFGTFGREELCKGMDYLQQKIVSWLARKHKDRSKERSRQHLKRCKEAQPTLFYHWEAGYV